MHFYNFLNRYFDVDKHDTFDASIQGSNETGKEVSEIWVYEKGNDMEPLLILKEAWWYSKNPKPNHWIVGNIYSTLENGLEISETEFRALVKAGKVISQYQ